MVDRIGHLELSQVGRSTRAPTVQSWPVAPNVISNAMFESLLPTVVNCGQQDDATSTIRTSFSP